MKPDRQYFVYIMANEGRMLYAGVTGNLERRCSEHKRKLTPGYASKYGVTRLVYYEATNDINAAIAREKQIKGWVRARKIALIESGNPNWQDLSADWFPDEESGTACDVGGKTLRGVYPEHQGKILRGACPEHRGKILRYAQNDRVRRAPD